jgi:hypothetical protein
MTSSREGVPVEATAEERLTERLASLYAELPDDEKELLIITLALAGSSRVEESSEVQGFSWLFSGLQYQDKMGNFDVQRLMSSYNDEARGLMSSALQKSSAVRGAIGST